MHQKLLELALFVAEAGREETSRAYANERSCRF